MKYYGIVYDNNICAWSLIQPRGYESIKEAQEATKAIMGWSEDQRRTNVVHEMWIECLKDWPSPEEQDEAIRHCLYLKSQESFPQTE